MKNPERRWIEKQIRDSALRGNEAVSNRDMEKMHYWNGFGDALVKVLEQANQRPKRKIIPKKVRT